MLKGKYRKLVDEKLAARARHFLDIARSLPDAFWKDCSWTTGDGKDITPASLGKRSFLLVASRNPMADWKTSGLCSIGQGELQNLTIVI